MEEYSKIIIFIHLHSIPSSQRCLIIQVKANRKASIIDIKATPVIWTDAFNFQNLSMTRSN